MFKKNCDKEIKIYVNVLYHDRVKLALNEKGEEIKIEFIKSWA